MHPNEHMSVVTRRYIIEFLNALLFSNTVLWDGVDQYNELPIIESIKFPKDEKNDGLTQESRSALLVDRGASEVLRLVVTPQELSYKSVCYRLASLTAPVTLENPKLNLYPLESTKIDFSISDLQLGTNEPSSYAFCDNTAADGSVTNQRLFKLLKFLISSELYAYDDRDLFMDLAGILSTPPVSSDPHYIPIFGVSES